MAKSKPKLGGRTARPSARPERAAKRAALSRLVGLEQAPAAAPGLMGVPAGELTPRVQGAILELSTQVERLGGELEAAQKRIAQLELLADRDGWLRARGEAGTTWSDADFLCTSASRTSGTSRASGLDTLIARMDAEPVRYVKGGFIH